MQLKDTEVPNNALLEARVRAQLGRVASHARAIEATAQQGRVTLRGLSPGK